MIAESQYKTWAEYHPEVAQNLRRTLLAWPCEQVMTDLGGCHQPMIVMGPDGELFSHGATPDKRAALFHSTDRGRTWGQLCTADLQAPPIPPGMQGHASVLGVGVTVNGTLLLSCRRFYHDGRDVVDQGNPSFHDETWILRSTDRGRIWEHAGMLDPSPYQTLGGAKARVHQMRDMRLLYPVNAANWSRPGKPLDRDEWSERALLFTSDDDGESWHRLSSLGEHSDESDLEELPSGRILATTRYQRKKKSFDPPELITPYWLEEDHPRETCAVCRRGPGAIGGHSVYKHTAVLHSDDRGRTWSEPRIVTGWVQQTACLVRLSDGTIVMPFGHKDAGQGQRFMLSYDDGETWSNALFELNRFGMYAHSVVLDDDTIVTVCETPRWFQPVKLHVLRWNVPPRDEVERYGFFMPRPV